jgi:hypothetical protein
MKERVRKKVSIKKKNEKRKNIYMSMYDIIIK